MMVAELGTKGAVWRSIRVEKGKVELSSEEETVGVWW
jgi:hypothetical protein